MIRSVTGHVRPPAGRCATLRRARRAGYTLLEVSVVVAMLVMVAAIAIPSIVGRLSDARIDASGDLIRARLADARSMAVELGRPVRFGYVAGTGKFQIAPDDDPAWDIVQSSDPIETGSLIRGELLADVLFASEMSSLSNGGTPSAGTSWQTGGVFLPEGGARGAINPSDGSYSDDVVFYFGKAGLIPNAVEVRGLTGASRLFDPSAEGN